MGNKANRIPELESLLGIAALSVMLFQNTIILKGSLKYGNSALFDFKYGHYGLELFFMLSSFVIFLFHTRISSFEEFLHKKFVRLYPFIFIFISLVSVIFIKDNMEMFYFTSGFVFLFYLLISNKLYFLNNSVLIFFGKISYPLYLIHQTIGFIFIYSLILLGIHPLFSIILVTIGTIGLSYVFYKYLEQPILKKLR